MYGILYLGINSLRVPCRHQDELVHGMFPLAVVILRRGHCCWVSREDFLPSDKHLDRREFRYRKIQRGSKRHNMLEEKWKHPSADEQELLLKDSF